jgi:hypothetical protein
MSPSQDRYLHRTTQTPNESRQTFIPRVGFEPMIPVFERAKTFHALYRAATVIGFLQIVFFIFLYFFCELLNSTQRFLSNIRCSSIDLGYKTFPLKNKPENSSYVSIEARKQELHVWDQSNIQDHLRAAIDALHLFNVAGGKHASMLVSCLAYSSTLNMETTCFSETSVDFQRTIRRYIPEDRTLRLVLQFEKRCRPKCKIDPF